MQTSGYNAPEAGFAGQLLTIGERPDIEALTIEMGAVSFGKGLVRGTDPEKQAKLPAAVFTAVDVAGVSIASAARFERLYKQTGFPTVAVGEQIDLLRAGYVKVEAKVAPIVRGQSVYLQHTAFGNYVPGDFHNDGAEVTGARAVDVSLIFSWYRGAAIIGAFAILQPSVKG